MDAIDRSIVNLLQDGIPICDRPFADAASRLGISESELLARLTALRADGTLSRFGPMYNAEEFGGAVSLAAVAVSAADFDAVAAKVNEHPEVAHNCARDHEFNMWFVVAAEQPEEVARIIAAIEAETGLKVMNVPKLREFRVNLRFAA